MHVTEINIYPVKSLKGIGLNEARVSERGFEHDRRWMITDRDGKFFTQRELPKMAAISIKLGAGGLLFSAPGVEDLAVAARPAEENLRNVRIWNSVCEALVYDGDASEWFSEVLGTGCQLVYMPDETRRGINPLFNRGDDIVSFADGYPFMALGEASVEDLNSRLEEPVPMNRFRPNLVVAGSEPYAEDDWKSIRIGGTVFRSIKPCARCTITTVDQTRGEFAGKEPLRTLAGYRRAEQLLPETYAALGMGKNDVLYGKYFVPEDVGGVVRVGDEVLVDF